MIIPKINSKLYIFTKVHGMKVNNELKSYEEIEKINCKTFAKIFCQNKLYFAPHTPLSNLFNQSIKM